MPIVNVTPPKRSAPQAPENATRSFQSPLLRGACARPRPRALQEFCLLRCQQCSSNTTNAYYEVWVDWTAPRIDITRTRGGRDEGSGQLMGGVATRTPQESASYGNGPHHVLTVNAHTCMENIQFSFGVE
eukprot:gene16848-biopygen3818